MNTNEKARWLCEFYSALSERGLRAVNTKNDTLSLAGPNLTSNVEDWKILSAEKPVDLSTLVGSGVICEFAPTPTSVWNRMGRLLRIISDDWATTYVSGNTGFHTCRPLMEYTHHWKGGDCPLPKGFIVTALFRDGGETTQPVDTLRWEHAGNSTDIISFEVFGLEEGYCYPWEVKYDD